MEGTIYNQKGKESGKISLPEAVFGLKWNADLVHQVVVSMESSARTPVAHAKNRGDVRGGGKKPWKQKGTGRARHGSIRSPLWRHGGVTHGPTNLKNFDRKINKKMKAKALYTILSKKFKDNQVVFVDKIEFSSIKTKFAKEVMDSLFDKASKKKNNAILLTIPKKDKNVEKSFSNFGNLKVDEIRNISPIDLMKYKYVAIVDPEKGLPQISNKIEVRVKSKELRKIQNSDSKLDTHNS
ncbi:MAG: 50S ribosomal protein L4 [Parcubacteria group bacterium GW2011_GWF2_39_8b]|uniref:Large ribosomal subunit protein uL4 n=3 Tax=Candidatus Zambryskiibacteriota TaxID=1817925 RepID=A0A1G2T6B5_9BACT|nr:MAG: 50S ribosomal protein L4 [Parcubacteria group bacterium GW2011_GWF2_39_8b]KKR46194.1 MAG: 50S ribosomal protein L4 [Parcubacteria group bacterium GW2011_GWA2_40_14]OHA92813.1 MAG: 50S ribosomal protein L4 [Candidatus Zambryskibacteria bacterium RIFCSPHIGHO2_02_38_10.5]OHA98613.1 MAG: 50S ribosomal protein L4 [Candidatus Zambryskibacteria bacterium RIFCSPHIGHO2_12_FULL_38_37]OHB09229.1 MAG: 50S ribosomal protein L4 [Candidatus Zambryskibacteria bacterium RIFCSPLOWO2_02_39_10]OHB10688.1 